MLTELFGALTDIVTGLVASVVSAVNGILVVFYDGTEFTPLGLLLLIGFGLFFVMFAWRVIQGLIRGRGN